MEKTMNKRIILALLVFFPSSQILAMTNEKTFDEKFRENLINNIKNKKNKNQKKPSKPEIKPQENAKPQEVKNNFPQEIKPIDPIKPENTDDDQSILNQSIIKTAHIDAKKLLTSLKQEQAENPIEPLIYYIAAHADHLKSLILLGYEDNAFTPKDIKWAILNKENQKEIYDDLIILNLNDKKRKDILLNLITEISLSKNNPKGLLNPRSHSEFNNILIETIKLSFIDTFEILINNMPKNNFLYTLPSLTRQERKIEKEGYFYNSYGYELKTYSLLSWLMRSKDNNFHFHIEQKLEKNYIDALKILLKNEIENEQNAKFDGEFLGAFLLIKRLLSKSFDEKNQNDVILNNISLEEIITRVNSLNGLVYEAIPPSQKIILEEVLKKEGSHLMNQEK